jgi:type III secretory pathway component EscV
MQTQNTQSINKMVSISSTLYYFAKKQAETRGIGFQEYIRYLLVREKEREDEPLYMVDEETEEEIGKSLESIKNGDYVDCKTPEEAQEYLKKLDALEDEK